jgi:acyl carrier protein
MSLALPDQTLPDQTLPDRGLLEWLRGRVADYAMVAPEEVDPDQLLTDYGLDSVYAVSLCAELHDAFGIDVDPADTVRFPTVLRLASHLSTAGSAEHGRWVR